MAGDMTILSSQKLSVLIVDDDLAQLMLVRMLVEQQGYDVLTASNGEEALELFRVNTDIRLVVTDLDMPHMDGFELIRRIRQEQTRYTYIIVLTSHEA